MKTKLEPYVFYEGEYIWVSALHRFARASIMGRNMSISVVTDNPDASDEWLRENYDLTQEQIDGIRGEWALNQNSIIWAERRARDFMAGFYYGQQYDIEREIEKAEAAKGEPACLLCRDTGEDPEDGCCPCPAHCAAVRKLYPSMFNEDGSVRGPRVKRRPRPQRKES